MPESLTALREVAAPAPGANVRNPAAAVPVEGALHTSARQVAVPRPKPPISSDHVELMKASGPYYREILENEERDPVWAAAAEEELRASFDEALRMGYQLFWLECRATICEVQYSGPNVQRADIPVPFRPFDSIEPSEYHKRGTSQLAPDGRNVGVLWFLKKGHHED